MNKDEKRKKVESLHEELDQARTVILSGFEGLTVAADTQLRRKIGETGGHYQVAKNSFIERAAEGTRAAPLAQKLRGTTSLAYTSADPVALAKVLTSYAKENPALVFKAGMVEGRVVSMAEITALASLPSRDELLAKALFLINAPAQRLASVLAGVGRQLAVVLQQAVKENKFQPTADE